MIDEILSGRVKSMIFPKFGIHSLPEGRIVSRLLGKMGLEKLSSIFSEYPEGLEEMAEMAALNPIRFHVRRGTPKEWPYSIREIDDFEQLFVNEEGEEIEILHELDLLILEQEGGMIIYVIFLLHGMEFALCLNDPEIDGYYKWLEENNNESPLRIGKNKNSRYSKKPIPGRNNP